MTTGSATTAFFDRTFDEAMALLVEARDYAAAARDGGPGPAAMPGDLRVCAESFRRTTRLTQVMAWLLAQRAVFTGELSPTEVAGDPRWRPGAASTCRDARWHEHPAISPELRDLLDRSHHLYVRVARLDELGRRQPTAKPT